MIRLLMDLLKELWNMSLRLSVVIVKKTMKSPGNSLKKNTV